MQQSKVIEETIILDKESPNIVFRAYVPFARESLSELHTDEDGRKYRIAYGPILVDRRAIQEKMGWSDDEAADHFTTFFEIDGLVTDVRKVNFDFRHNGISTGAEGFRSYVVKDYKIEIGDQVLEVPARILEVKVFEDSRLRIKDDTGRTVEDGDLLTGLQNGRIKSWSIEFKPLKQATTRSGTTIYRTYHTPRISFLDVTQGIPDASIDGLRSYLSEEEVNNQTSNNMSIEEIKKALESGDITKEQLMDLVKPESTEEKPKESETDREIPVEKDKEAPAEEPKGEATAESDKPSEDPKPEEDKKPSDEEDMRGVITKLSERMDSIEAMLASQKGEGRSLEEQKEIDEAAKIAEITRSLNSAPEKLEAKEGEKPADALSSLSSPDNKASQLTEEQIKQQQENTRLAQYRQANGILISK